MTCGYKIGKLKNFIYLVDGLLYDQADYQVNIIAGTITKLDADLVTFNETESFSGRFKFTTLVVCTYNRIINDAIFRKKSYHIIVEDLNGMQFLVSPEFTAVYTSEFNIEDSINYLITFTTQSNIPTKIIQWNVIEKWNVRKPCTYQGQSITEVYLEKDGVYNKVDCFNPTYNKTFNGVYDQTQITFALPIERNNDHYDLIKFPNNRYNVRLKIGTDTIEEKSLFPQYTRQTAEEGLDKIVITLKGMYNGTLIEEAVENPLYQWLLVDGYVCQDKNKYEKEQLFRYNNNRWEPQQEFRKGRLLEENAIDCGYKPDPIYRWIPMIGTSNYICVRYNKCRKELREVSYDKGLTWKKEQVFRPGAVLEINSRDCGYEFIEWKPVEGEYICDEYDPSASWILADNEFICELI